MKSLPLVSIIITTYYRNDALCRAIESVQQQTYDRIEIIVVDDSGEGHAEEAIDDPEITYISKDSNEGQISAWNTGIEHCSGEYVQFFDDDDRMAPSKIEKQVELLRAKENVGVVYCGMEWESGETVSPVISGDVLQDVLTFDTSPCVTSAMVMRRDILEEIAPIPRYPASTDNVLKIELAQHTHFDFVDEPLIRRGEGADNISHSMKTIDAMWQMMEEYDALYDQCPSHVRREAISLIYYSKGRRYFERNPLSLRARLLFVYSIILYPEFNRSKFAALLRSLGGKYAVAVGKRVETALNRIPRV